MAALKNFTLEGKALRLTAYEDHHGVKRYEADILPEFDRRDMSGADLMRFALGLKEDVEEWGGLFALCAGEFTDRTLAAFYEGPESQEET